MTAPAPAFVPSPYQARFFDWLRDGRGSAVLVAVAGSGKTTTVIRGLPLIPRGKTVRLLAFNKTIADELNARIEDLRRDGAVLPDASASTFHSLGFGAVRKFLGPSVRLVVDGKKVPKILRDQLGAEDLETYGDFAARLVSLARGRGIGALVPDLDEAWWDLVRHHDLLLPTEDATEERGIAIARATLAESNRRARTGLIDFDDQLYLVVLWKLRLWQNDLVIVDEAQDTNDVRRALAKLALRPGGRLIAVGDPRQAIYGFTGASHDALDLIRREFDAIELPLTVCYRCARSIVARAAEIVDHIEAHDAAPAGTVETLPLDRALPLLTARDAVLCRQTAPLVGLAYALIARGTACRVLGKEIGSGLVALIKRQRARSVDDLLKKLTTYRDREVAKFTAKGEEAKAEAVTDRVACVETIVENLGERDRTLAKLVERIETMFSDDNGVLTLSTVHKAKGKEWDRVAILRPSLMPSKWARQDWQRLQEDNLIYVARTRARSHLIELLDEKKEPK